MNKLSNRIAKLETKMKPIKQQKYLLTFSNQIGLIGEVIREETDEEVISKHLQQHPEDEGTEFSIINRVVVHPAGLDIAGNNIW